MDPYDGELLRSYLLNVRFKGKRSNPTGSKRQNEIIILYAGNKNTRLLTRKCVLGTVVARWTAAILGRGQPGLHTSYRKGLLAVAEVAQSPHTETRRSYSLLVKKINDF